MAGFEYRSALRAGVAIPAHPLALGDLAQLLGLPDVDDRTVDDPRVHAGS